MFYLFVRELYGNGSFKALRCWHVCITSKQHGKMIVSSWCWGSAWNSCHSICCCSISLSLGISAGRRFPLLTEFLILVWCRGMQMRSPSGARVGRRAWLKLQASSAAATTNFSRSVHLFGERGVGRRRKAYWLSKKAASPSAEASPPAASWFVATAVPLLQVFSLSHQR